MTATTSKSPKTRKPPKQKRADETAIASAPLPKGKLGAIVELLGRPQGAALAEMCEATGWAKHSVRGALSGALKRQRGYVIESDLVEGQRRYRARPGTAT